LITTRADYLILEVDEHLAHIPWELIYVNKQFLCQRFNMGRIPATRRKMGECEQRDMKKPLSLWILANPSGDLENAALEGEKICNYMDRFLEKVRANFHSKVSPEQVRKEIKDYDWVHFAGHVDYDAKIPGQSGWRLTDGRFTADDIENMAVGKAMPAFVFSNACQSARTEKLKWKDDEDKSFGLVNAFISGGVKHYLGTSWKITDKPGSRFAPLFYKHILSGKTVGEAVRRARLRLMEDASDASWASYLLYGDPTISYFGQSQSADRVIKLSLTKEQTKVRKSVSRSDQSKRNLSLQKSHIAYSIIITLFLVCFGFILSDQMNQPNQAESVRTERLKLIEEKERKRQEEITQLLEALGKFADSSGALKFERPRSDGWTSEAPTLTVLFDPARNFVNQDKDKFIAITVQHRIIRHSHFRVLNRMSLDNLLRELILANSKSIPPENRLMPKLLSAKLILSIEVVHFEPKIFVLMHLADTREGHFVGIFTEQLEEFPPTPEQREKFTKALLETLKEHYPIRGKVSEVTDEKIILNIGENVGVKVGQRFRMVDKDAILKVVAVRADTCTVKMEKGEPVLKKGWRVKAI